RLLVAGHPGVEHHFAERFAARAEPGAVIGGPVLEHQDRWPGALCYSRPRAALVPPPRFAPVPALRPPRCGVGLPRHQAGFPSSTVARPRRNVATTWPGRVSPANGELRLREAWVAGSTAELAAGS